MKAELIPKPGNRVEIRIAVDGQVWTFMGPVQSTVVEELLVGEAERFHKQLGDLIKQAHQIQRGGVKKLGTY